MFPCEGFLYQRALCESHVTEWFITCKERKASQAEGVFEPAKALIILSVVIGREQSSCVDSMDRADGHPGIFVAETCLCSGAAHIQC